MKINNHLTSPLYNNNQSSNPSFGNANAAKSTARKVFEFVGNQCNIESNGSLTRIMFFIVGGIFMLGSRFIEARGKDEKREVLTRDIPGVALTAFCAPTLNNLLAASVTKKWGIPIVKSSDNKFAIAKINGKFMEFTSQKQIKDWYSELSKMDNPLITFSETVERNGGSIAKVMKKLGFDKELEAISKSSENKEIIKALKTSGSTKAFGKLEELIKNIPADNKLLKFAKNAQACVKVGMIGITAALLGFIIPRLNIVITKKKYTDPVQSGSKNPIKVDMSKTTNPNAYFISFHNQSAAKTFKSFLG
jgi:hypothetical protein